VDPSPPRCARSLAPHAARRHRGPDRPHVARLQQRRLGRNGGHRLDDGHDDVNHVDDDYDHNHDAGLVNVSNQCAPILTAMV